MLHLPRFLRKWIRKHTRPKAPETALKKRSKISLLYAFITWNLLGLIVYTIVRKREETPASERVSDGRYFTDLLVLKNVKLMRYRGITKLGEWDLEEERRTHGKLLTDLELEAYNAEQQQLKEEQGEQQQHVESDRNDGEEFDVTN